MNSLESIFLNGILIAIVAHGLIGISLIWGKVLLESKQMQNLLSYVFWLASILKSSSLNRPEHLTMNVIREAFQG